MSRETGQPRTRCRLPCTIRAGRKRIRARVLDVSAGGLCIVSPVRFRPHARMHIEIIVPRRGPVAVEAEVLHRRPFRHASSGRRGWATGLALAYAGPEFLALSSPGALAGHGEREGVVEVLRRASRTGTLDPSVEERLGATRPAPAAAAAASAGSRFPLNVEMQPLFRVRLKQVGGARTRTLTLRAVSEAAVCDAVLRDLPGDWEVLGVEANPID